MAEQTTYESVTYEKFSFLTNKDSVKVPEGKTVTFKVKLSAQPSSDVLATLSRGSGGEDIKVKYGQKFHNLSFLHATDKKSKKSG